MEHEVIARASTGWWLGLMSRRGQTVEEGKALACWSGANAPARPRVTRARPPRGAAAIRARRPACGTRASRARLGRGARRGRGPPGTRPAGARRARTSPTWSTRARSWSTARSSFAAQERRRTREELIAPHACGRSGGRCGGGPGRAPAGDVLRLHGAGGNAGQAGPPEERPPVRDRGAMAAAGRVLRRGRRRAPGDTDCRSVAGARLPPSTLSARLSGLVPLVGIISGRCFAGNAALLGCCDVVIATEDSSIGMGGPAMIEGGGLGVHGRRRSGRSTYRSQRRRRLCRRRRARGGRWPSVPLVLPGPAAELAVRRPAHAAPR